MPEYLRYNLCFVKKIYQLTIEVQKKDFIQSFIQVSLLMSVSGLFFLLRVFVFLLPKYIFPSCYFCPSSFF